MRGTALQRPSVLPLFEHYLHAAQNEIMYTPALGVPIFALCPCPNSAKCPLSGRALHDTVKKKRYRVAAGSATDPYNVYDFLLMHDSPSVRRLMPGVMNGVRFFDAPRKLVHEYTQRSKTIVF